jgi:F420-non-reducing hydrogenase large subunit
MSHTITVNPVTRIEGHAKISLDLDDGGQVLNSHLQVLEMRGFEKLLTGMELFKMPLITARICGVCPAAHHLAAVNAIENGLAAEIPAEAQLLRELLYMGHVLHSHALSVFVLSGPDMLLGVGAPPADRNVFNLLRVNPELAKKVLRLRSIGQRVVEAVGGRGVHPVTAVVGGMASRPTGEQLATMVKWGLDAMEIVDEMSAVLRDRLDKLREFRDSVRLPFHSLALSDGGSVSFLKGGLVAMNQAGAVERTFPIAGYAAHLIEHVMPGSYMKAVRLRGEEERAFFVGPLARLGTNSRAGAPKAQAMLDEFRAGSRRRDAALDYVDARVVEMMLCAERISTIAGEELTGGPIYTPCEVKEGRYVGAVEAARGVLIHDYTSDAQGRVAAVNLIVATQNNYNAIDHALKAAGQLYLPQKDDNLLMNGLEFALRCFDPCLSCATHAVGRMPMEVIVTRAGAPGRTITRRADR